MCVLQTPVNNVWFTLLLHPLLTDLLVHHFVCYRKYGNFAVEFTKTGIFTMVYNSFNFIVIFPILFLLYYIIPSKHYQVRNLYLLIVSYFLYLQWKPAYALILLGITTITYYAARYIEEKSSYNNRTLISFNIIVALLPLLVFKYYNFLNESISSFLASIGIQFHLAGLNWAIPVGISFFTFQAIGYVWDVYYQKQKAERNFLDYALFISFFPSIVSGPINKASLVLPQIKQHRVFFDYPKAVQGLRFLLWGMFMKVVVADRLALVVDVIYPHYNNYSSFSCLITSLFYTIQIYADFAGYSLMALGVGKLLGFELTENFRRPYFAVSVTDFWHRWHISLSTWLKDYIYIPLGGSRCSKARNYWNIFVTFLVSGIWHGANWTFIVWGIWHGLFQIIEKALHQQKCQYGAFGKTIKIAITFILVNFAWIFFRMETLTDAVNVIKKIVTMNSLTFDLKVSLTDGVLIAIALLCLFVKDFRDEFFPNKLRLFENPKRLIRWSSYIIIMMMILLCGVFDSSQFIYAYF